MIQTNGRFAEGEAIQVNGVDFPAGIGTVTTFGINDVRGVKQKGAANFPGDGATGGTNINFKARPVLRKAPLPNNTVDIIVGPAGIATAVNASAGGFTGLKHDDIIIYTNPEYPEQVYNRVDSVFNDGKTIQLAAVAAGLGTGIYNGNLPVTTPSSGTQSVQAFLGVPNIRTSETGLFAPLPDANLSLIHI